MAKDWESGHFTIVKPELPHAVVIASSEPLTEVELDKIAWAYGKMLKIEVLEAVVGFAWRISIEPHNR